MSHSRQSKDDRLTALKRAVRCPLAAVLVVVTLVVVTALVAAATRTLAWLVRGVLAIYFPPPFVTGGPDLRLKPPRHAHSVRSVIQTNPTLRGYKEKEQ